MGDELKKQELIKNLKNSRNVLINNKRDASLLYRSIGFHERLWHCLHIPVFSIGIPIKQCTHTMNNSIVKTTAFKSPSCPTFKNCHDIAIIEEFLRLVLTLKCEMLVWSASSAWIETGVARRSHRCSVH